MPLSGVELRHDSTWTRPILSWNDCGAPSGACIGTDTFLTKSNVELIERCAAPARYSKCTQRTVQSSGRPLVRQHAALSIPDNRRFFGANRRTVKPQ
jgi:hypothetical protein